MRAGGRLLWGIGLTVVLLLGGPLWMLTTERGGDHWAVASREPTGLAPREPGSAVVQIYAARTWGWRGAFGVHTWIVTREAGADDYLMHHVLSWRRPTLISQTTADPDRTWFGNAPALLADYRGESAERLIPAIEAAVAAYPATDRYRAWPGPNSNTFTAWVIREVEGFEAVLPVTAVGKDYLLDGPLAPAPGGHGLTAALGGMLGLTVGIDEGIEFNLLGLSFGVDLRRPALKLPGVERLGMAPLVKGSDDG